VPLEAPVVADIERLVRPQGEPVGSAPEIRDDGHLAIRRHARDRSARDFNQRDRAVYKRHRTLRKAQPRRQHFHIDHSVSFLVKRLYLLKRVYKP
jgi:hypothetical protein